LAWHLLCSEKGAGGGQGYWYCNEGAVKKELVEDMATGTVMYFSKQIH
jgi:hypothetical protein